MYLSWDYNLCICHEIIVSLCLLTCFYLLSVLVFSLHVLTRLSSLWLSLHVSNLCVCCQIIQTVCLSQTCIQSVHLSSDHPDCTLVTRVLSCVLVTRIQSVCLSSGYIEPLLLASSLYACYQGILRPRSGELWTQKLKSHLVRTQSLNVLPLKTGVGQYIAMHATLTARNFFLAYFYPSGLFTCIFSKPSPDFSCVCCG